MLIAWLSIGLQPGFQYLLLRFWLWSNHSLPFRLTHFLNDAHARHLLKRVGGTYRFMHRLLMEYFAELKP